MKRGEVYEWTPPGTSTYLGTTRPVTMEIKRVARDGTWVDVLCTGPNGSQWGNRHPAAPNCVPDGWRLRPVAQ